MTVPGSKPCALREVVFIQYDEIALKRGRRPYYQKRLLTGIENSLRDLGGPAIRIHQGRVELSGGKTEIPTGVIVDRVSRVFGVRFLLRGYLTGPTLPELQAAIARAASDRPDARSFGVRVRHPPAALATSSGALAAALGAFVAAETGWAVDLTAPDVWFEVLFVGAEAFVSAARTEGPGGLPIGTSGHGVALLSGGIDSPVAAWLMMGRGLKLSMVHFHSAPFTSRESQTKVRDLARRLARWQPTIELAMIPFAELQRALAAATPPRLRVILYRRFMVRIAERLARAVGATCLVTGDALAQVASQTIENLGTIDAAATMPVFRPLIGMPKPQVIEIGRRIGTYEISIRRHEDCCAFLLPEHPATATTAAELAEAERDLPVDAWVAAAVKGREVLSVRFEDTLRRPGAATIA